MAFINEKISEANWNKYELLKVDHYARAKGLGPMFTKKWTVDKERDIYLRKIAAKRYIAGDGKSEARISIWTFYWKNELIWFEELIIDYHPEPPCRVHSMLYNFSIPESIIDLKFDIFNDMYEAFYVYGIGGGLPEDCEKFIRELNFEYDTIGLCINQNIE